MTDATHPHDDLAVYALDALEPAERQAVDAHLAGCATCRRELEDHRGTLGALTVDEEPPTAVWAGISQQIRSGHAGPLPTTLVPAPAEPGDARPAPAGAPTRPVVLPPPSPEGDVPEDTGPEPRHLAPVGPDHRAWWRQGRVLAAAAAVVAVLGLVGALLAGGGGGGDDPRPDVAELAAVAADDPGSTLVTLSSATGEPVARVVVTDADHDDYVVFDGLPPVEPDHTYQLWRTDQGSPVSLGVLGTGADGAARVELPEGAAGFAISHEPTTAGSPTPTDIVAT